MRIALAKHSKAKQLMVFIRTSPCSHHSYDSFYINSATGVMVSPTDETGDCLNLAGVILADFCDEGIEQLHLFTNADNSYVHEATHVYRTNSALMTVLDDVNNSGKEQVF